MDEKTGLLGLVGVAVAAGLFLLLRRIFPSLATALLVTAGIALALLIALVVVVVILALRRPKDAPADRKQEITAVLSRGRANLMELRRLGLRIKNREIHKRADEICAVADKILHALREKPDDIPRVRKFFNYYLPTLGSILLKYVRLEESGVPAQNLTESTIACLGDIKSAMWKQYTNLFESDMLDLTVEMETLTLVCKRDGLLTDGKLTDGGRDIELTL